MFINRIMDTMIVIRSHNGILLNNKHNKALITYNMRESHIHYVDQKKPNTKKYVLYNSIYMKFQRRQN